MTVSVQNGCCGVIAPSAFLAELFPTRLRYSGLSLAFGLASNAAGVAWYASAVTAVAVACLTLPGLSSRGRRYARRAGW
jgi:hypothetical protein